MAQKTCKSILLSGAFTAIFLTVVAAFHPAAAAPRCYTSEQTAAENLLRLHSQLMVITVTCRRGSGGEDLSSAYSYFTRKNIGSIKTAEKTMSDYYRASSGGDGVSELDKLRTILANEFGQQVASVSAPVFCSRYADAVLSLRDASPVMVNDEIGRISLSHPPYAPPCSAKTPVKTADAPRRATK